MITQAMVLKVVKMGEFVEDPQSDRARCQAILSNINQGLRAWVYRKPDFEKGWTIRA